MIEELLKKYKKDIIRINEAYIYDDKDFGKGIIEGLSRAIKDLEELREKINGESYKIEFRNINREMRIVLVSEIIGADKE